MSIMNNMGPDGGTDVCFCSTQPDTSLCCETTDTRLVHVSK